MNKAEKILTIDRFDAYVDEVVEILHTVESQAMLKEKIKYTTEKLNVAGVNFRDTIKKL